MLAVTHGSQSFQQKNLTFIWTNGGPTSWLVVALQESKTQQLSVKLPVLVGMVATKMDSYRSLAELLLLVKGDHRRRRWYRRLDGNGSWSLPWPAGNVDSFGTWRCIELMVFASLFWALSSDFATYDAPKIIFKLFKFTARTSTLCHFN